MWFYSRINVSSGIDENSNFNSFMWIICYFIYFICNNSKNAKMQKCVNYHDLKSDSHLPKKLVLFASMKAL